MTTPVKGRSLSLLEHAGCDVRSAADGEEALQKVRTDNFDLMLLDIWMPRMDGLAEGTGVLHVLDVLN
jgi:CheY-like chemotaxis protein